MYGGRPGISPALAALIALKRIHRRQRILDVGCGTGTDLLTLARWGFKRLDGVDPDARSIGIARARATRLRLKRGVRFHHTAAEGLAATFPTKTFDVVLHTLVANNLTKNREKHFREVAAAMKPGGLLVLHERIGRPWENWAPGKIGPMKALQRHFDLSPGITTHIAEYSPGKGVPAYARVVFWLGRPKRRR